MTCEGCTNLIQTIYGPRCRYELNPIGQICLRGERFKPKEGGQ